MCKTKSVPRQNVTLYLEGARGPHLDPTLARPSRVSKLHKILNYIPSLQRPLYIPTDKSRQRQEALPRGSIPGARWGLRSYPLPRINGLRHARHPPQVFVTD